MHGLTKLLDRLRVSWERCKHFFNIMKSGPVRQWKNNNFRPPSSLRWMRVSQRWATSPGQEKSVSHTEHNLINVNKLTSMIFHSSSLRSFPWMTAKFGSSLRHTLRIKCLLAHKDLSSIAFDCQRVMTKSDGIIGWSEPSIQSSIWINKIDRRRNKAHSVWSI
jgi:hypothetical protein